MSAPARIASNAARSAGWLRSSVTPRLSALRYRNRPLSSRSGRSFGNGPRRRVTSPSGGSTLITRAPQSASSFAANAAATPCPHSTTETQSSGSDAEVPVESTYEGLALLGESAGFGQQRIQRASVIKLFQFI